MPSRSPVSGRSTSGAATLYSPPRELRTTSAVWSSSGVSRALRHGLGSARPSPILHGATTVPFRSTSSSGATSAASRTSVSTVSVISMGLAAVVPGASTCTCGPTSDSSAGGSIVGEVSTITSSPTDGDTTMAPSPSPGASIVVLTSFAKDVTAISSKRHWPSHPSSASVLPSSHCSSGPSMTALPQPAGKSVVVVVDGDGLVVEVDELLVELDEMLVDVDEVLVAVVDGAVDVVASGRLVDVEDDVLVLVVGGRLVDVVLDVLVVVGGRVLVVVTDVPSITIT